MSYEKLKDHIGHKLTVFNYGLGAEFTVECEDCNTVLYSEGKPNVEIVADVPDEDGNLNAEIHFNKGGELWTNYTYYFQLEDKNIVVSDLYDADHIKEYSTADSSKVAELILSNDVQLKSTARDLNLEDEFIAEINKLVKEHLV